MKYQLNHRKYINIKNLLEATTELVRQLDYKDLDLDQCNPLYILNLHRLCSDKEAIYEVMSKAYPYIVNQLVQQYCNKCTRVNFNEDTGFFCNVCNINSYISNYSMSEKEAQNG